MKFMDKLKVAKDAAGLGLGGVKGKISEIQKQDIEFKKKELEILEKFEEELNAIRSNQKIIIAKLNEIELVLK